MKMMSAPGLPGNQRRCFSLTSISVQGDGPVRISVVSPCRLGRGAAGCRSGPRMGSHVLFPPCICLHCQKCGQSERAQGEKSRPTTAMAITPADSCVWVTVINAMLIPTNAMGERPRENIYNQYMKNATPIRLIITMKNHPEMTQETRPLSHCLMTAKLLLVF